jgi:hypothetical protein
MGVEKGLEYFQFIYNIHLYTKLYNFKFGFQAVSNDIELFISLITFN